MQIKTTLLATALTLQSLTSLTAQACLPKPGSVRKTIECKAVDSGIDHGIFASISQEYSEKQMTLKLDVASQSIAGPRKILSEVATQSRSQSTTTFASENAELVYLTDTPMRAFLVLKKNGKTKIPMTCKILPQPRGC